MLTERDLARVRPYLMRKARFMLPCMPEDLVQETLLYLWEERNHYDRDTSLNRWAARMLRSMRNCLVDLHRLKQATDHASRLG
jgi:DNA-directed RNA polymerase specialized sigma24 family protein